MDDDILDAEIVEEDRHLPAVVESGGMVYRPTVVLSALEVQAQVDTLKEIQRNVLVKDVDYGVIPGTKKPSLLKPGAERLLQVFGLGHRMEQGEIEYDDKTGEKWGVYYTCVVTRSLPDREVVVATCQAYASYDEDRYWDNKYNRGNKLPPDQWKKSPWNTLVKMAQKRAMTGAALQATGASGLFTQDVDEDGYIPSSNQGSTSRAPEPARPPSKVATYNFRGWTIETEEQAAAIEARVDALTQRTNVLAQRKDEYAKAVQEKFKQVRSDDGGWPLSPTGLENWTAVLDEIEGQLPFEEAKS